MKLAKITSRGFTLLEVMVAMAILSMSLVALSEIDAGAIAMHTYAKKLNVATMLAREKMLDIETQLDEKGLPAEGDNIDPSEGTFEEEGFPSYTWSVQVVAPKAENLDPTKLVNLVLGGGSGDGSDGSAGGGTPDPGQAGGGLAEMLGNLTGLGSSSSSSSDSSGGPTSAGMSGLAGMAAGAMNGPAQLMITQITQMVREVRLTVRWYDGKVPQEFTVVEQIVSMGPSGQLQSAAGATTQKSAANPLDQ